MIHFLRLLLQTNFCGYPSSPVSQRMLSYVGFKFELSQERQEGKAERPNLVEGLPFLA